MKNLIYSYDGTWAGFLTVIFESFDRKEKPQNIVSETENVGLFDDLKTILTDEARANRVKKGLQKKSKKTYNRIYRVFLSEKENRELIGLELARLAFKNVAAVESDFGNPFVLKAKQINKEISREVHRMHAFVRFQKAQDKMWYAFIKPDFDVIPLIGKHFEKRYADQKWLIYDLKRQVGLFYDLQKVDYVKINFENKISEGRLPDEAIHSEERNYQNLWKRYFEHVDIKERKNMKLHIQHVPKRYWSLMTEKQL